MNLASSAFCPRSHLLCSVMKAAERDEGVLQIFLKIMNEDAFMDLNVQSKIRSHPDYDQTVNTAALGP